MVKHNVGGIDLYIDIQITLEVNLNIVSILHISRSREKSHLYFPNIVYGIAKDRYLTGSMLTLLAIEICMQYRLKKVI